MVDPIQKRIRTAVLYEADTIRRKWLFTYPKLDLPNIRNYSLTKIRKGILKKQFPGWYRMAQIPQYDDWHDVNALEHTLDVLGAIRTWYKKMPLKKISHQYIIKEHFNREMWGIKRTRMQWFEWAIFFHEIGKLTTARHTKKTTQFFGHEMAGGALLEKWIVAVDITPPAQKYIKNMIMTHGTIDTILEDSELTHHGVLIRVKKQYSNFEVLELLLISLATLVGTKFKKNNPKEYKRRKRILNAAIIQILDEIEVSTTA